MALDFDYEGALEAGYSHNEIKEHFREKRKNFNFEGAREAGYSDKEIDKYLSGGNRKPAARNYLQSTNPVDAHPGGKLGEYIEPAVQAAAKNPNQLAKELPAAALKAASNALSLFTPTSPITKGMDIAFDREPSPTLPQALSKMAEEPLAKLTRKGLSEEDQAGAERIAEAESHVLGLLPFGPKGASAAKGSSKSGRIAEELMPTRFPKKPKSPFIPHEGRENIPPELMEGIGDKWLSKMKKTEQAAAQASPKYESTFEKLEPYLESQRKAGIPLESIPSADIGKRLGLEIKMEQPTSARGLNGKNVEVIETAPGSSISKKSPPTDAKGGKDLNILNKATEAERRTKATQLYDAANESYASMSGEFSALSHNLENRLQQLESSLIPGGKESALASEIRSLLEEIGTFGQAGFKEIPVSRLISSSKSLKTSLKYGSPQEGINRLTLATAEEIERAARNLIKSKGGDLTSLNAARDYFKEYARVFRNPEIRPYLKTNVNNPEKLFKDASSNPGKYRAVEQALPPGQAGQEMRDALARSYAENHMKDYLGEKAKEIGSRQYTKDLNNLREVIGSKKTEAFDQALRNRRKFIDKIPQLQMKVQKTNQKLEDLAERGAAVKNRNDQAQKTYEQAAKRTPEDVIKKMNSRTGIKQLRNELPGELFDSMAEQKIRSIIQDGRVHVQKFDGKAVAGIINQEKNYEILTELMGKEGVEALSKLFTDLGSQQITTQIMAKVLQNVAKWGGSFGLGAVYMKPFKAMLVSILQATS